jgi:nucleoid-associated protein YgaU
MAAKYLGSNTTANRPAILDANPALKANPAKVILGHTYMIPAKATVAAEAAPAIPDTVPVTNSLVSMDATKVQELMTKPQTPATAAKPAVKTSGTSYTVKANDTLWKIASTQLGDAGMVKEIQDLNKSVLKGKADLRPGMTLKLPAKTAVASR